MTKFINIGNYGYNLDSLKKYFTDDLILYLVFDVGQRISRREIRITEKNTRYIVSLLNIDISEIDPQIKTIDLYAEALTYFIEKGDLCTLRFKEWKNLNSC